MSEIPATEASRKTLGEIFVEQGIISEKTRERVLQRARQLGRRFGSVLEDLELITGEELAAALAIQYDRRLLSNLPRLKVDPEVLQLLSIEAAMQHLIFPIKREGQRLAVAMADPADSRVIENLAADTGLEVIPFVATKQDIREAICYRYLNQRVTRPDRPTVLVVDDDQLFRAMLTGILEKVGYQVLTARDGLEAFKVVIAQCPHVIISDLEMPLLNGYGLLSALQNIPETSFIPVIMITGRARDEEEELKAFQTGFFDVIMKPFTAASVQARVKRAFHFYEHQYRLF
jgi:CheY-like chemotaxis protein